MNKSNTAGKMLVTITIIIIGLLLVLYLLNNASKSKVITYDNAPSIDGQPVVGDENAPVTVIEFGDFKCPSCKSWGETIYPQLEADYIETGKVKFAFVNVLFHGEESQTGSLAAETILKQSPEKYWEFHEALFADQPDTQNHNEQWLTEEKAIEIASTIEGIDIEAFANSLTNKEEMSQVEHDMDLVEEYAVKVTPTIMVNNKKLDEPFDYDKLKNLIDQELEGK